jgi:hypothetical protein
MTSPAGVRGQLNMLGDSRVVFGKVYLGEVGVGLGKWGCLHFEVYNLNFDILSFELLDFEKT